jgi:hypothetical protein
MSRRWSKTDAFAHYDVEMENTRWSWSGISDDGRSAVLVLWADRVRRDPSGNFIYEDDKDLDAAWGRRPGHSARVRHLIHVRDELGGRFNAIIARAEDVNASPRKIDSCYPHEGVIWTLTKFDPSSGAFAARAERA